MEKTAVRMRIKTPKRRSPLEKLKARLYYRRNRTKIRMQRKRYLRTHRSILKKRKMFKRFRPSWLRRKRSSSRIKFCSFNIRAFSILTNELKSIFGVEDIKNLKNHLLLENGWGKSKN